MFQSSCISSRRSYVDLTLSHLFAHLSSLAGTDAKADFLFFFKPSTSDNTRVVWPNPLKRPVLRAGLLCLSSEFVSSRQCEQEGRGFDYCIWNQGLSVFKRVTFECLRYFQQHVSTQMACGWEGRRGLLHSVDKWRTHSRRHKSVPDRVPPAGQFIHYSSTGMMNASLCIWVSELIKGFCLVYLFLFKWVGYFCFNFS